MTSPPDPAEGQLLASGRAADVYDLGDGTVLRRYRGDFSTELEGRAMTWVAEQGVRVPSVHRAEGRDLVMERIDGPTMLDDLGARPWMLVPHARLLARLQKQINALDAPDWFPTHEGVTAGASVLHLDLHPMNVLISPTGPVVIDWTNASRGDAAFEGAMTYVLMSSFEVTGIRDRLGQRVLVGSFALSRGRRALRRALPAAARYRLADENMTDGERRNLQKLIERDS